MANNAGSLAKRAIILELYTSGLRSATFRAIRYGDVKEELRRGEKIISIHVYPEMKKVIPQACKGGIPYITFLSMEATEALRVYMEEREKLYGPTPDTAKLLGYPEDRIKRIEEALAKYKSVDEAMNEIRKLSLESYKVKNNSDPKKVIKEDELEHYLAEGWDVHTVLPRWIIFS
jgi:hypothetical protein